MNTATDIPEFPNYPTGAHPVIYVSTDRDAQEFGCAWGLLIAHISGGFWALTSIGVRYYGIESEHEFLTRRDPRWASVNASWRAGLDLVSQLQSAAQSVE